MNGTLEDIIVIEMSLGEEVVIAPSTYENERFHAILKLSSFEGPLSTNHLKFWYHTWKRLQ